MCFGGKAYVSNQSDALGAFTRFLATDGNAISGSRLSGAIAPSDPNVMYVLGSSGVLTGLHISRDKGATVYEIVPGGAPSIDPFRRDASSTTGQGGYDDAIAVDPSDWGHIIVGGIRLFEWRYATGSNPIGGSWLLAATLGGGSFGVHADKHTIAWPTANTIYIGSDGGVTRSVDGGMTWQERNLGYNVTSFYDVATASNGWIVGGSQDNGDLLFSYGAFGSTSPWGAVTLFPTDGQTFGDGFDVAFSNQGPGIVYATAQNGALWRTAASIGGGGFFDPELADVIAAGSGFHTVIENWVKDYDVTSIDSITMHFSDTVGTLVGPQDTVFAGQTILAGDTIWYASLTNATPLMYIAPSNIVLNTPGDSIKLQDPIQNRFAMVAGSYVYVTRDAARLGSATGAEWHRVASAGGALVLEFSEDGNDLYIGRSNGIVKISGLNLANDSLGLDMRSPSSILTSTSSTGISGLVTGIAADPNDLDNLIVTTGGYSTINHVYRCTNATTTMSFTAIQGVASSLPKMPVYDVVIDYNDNNKVIVGTEWGVWTTDNAFSAIAGSLVEWTDESGNGMTHTPVHGVIQQHLRSTASLNSGWVYLGTHGRGFYGSDGLATSIAENEDIIDNNDNGFVTNLNVYPNPLSNVGVLAFDLKENKETTVKIFNLTGSLVKTIKLGALAKGNHKVKFDASALSIGSYIISLESGSERSVAKFIVTR
ncbi:MAG: T9SS type A sorting domain-containing protein [Flavobacteriales bacterium]|nr:T9SS type A sorting domain-containing protein [Flavobacteriales bacterium]